MDLMSKRYRDYRCNEFMHIFPILTEKNLYIVYSWCLLIENNIRFLYDQNFIHWPLNRHDKLNFEFNQIILQATINFIWMSILAIFAFSLETLIYPTPFAHPSPHTIKRAYILISSFCAAFVLFKPFQYQGWNIRIW